MITKDRNKLSTTFLHAMDKHFCPECSAQMIEVDRRNENRALYVWYECGRDNCEGQWLQKMPGSILK
ncbi:MAG: hypothetical protein ACYTBV_05885 [Planctomycetota bacterium]|jgi:predicted RNA-binding Zn-ribbon protein involved in translation (DUF1610 family)